MKSPDKEIRHAISPKNRNQNEAKKRFSEMVPMKKTETGAILPKVKPLSNNFFPEATERELKLRWTAHRRVRSKIEESSFMGEL